MIFYCHSVIDQYDNCISLVFSMRLPLKLLKADNGDTIDLLYLQGKYSISGGLRRFAFAGTVFFDYL